MATDGGVQLIAAGPTARSTTNRRVGMAATGSVSDAQSREGTQLLAGRELAKIVDAVSTSHRASHRFRLGLTPGLIER